MLPFFLGLVVFILATTAIWYLCDYLGWDARLKKLLLIVIAIAFVLYLMNNFGVIRLA